MSKRIINAVEIDDDTQIKYISNPKRRGCASWERYERYQIAETVGEYLELNAIMIKSL